MAFQNFSSLQTIICPSCEGKGCSECGNFGVYALANERTITFNLPPYLDIKKRKQAKITFLIKNGVLFLIGLILIVILWGIINNL